MRAMDVRPQAGLEVAGLEVLSREECLSLMATVSVGRLGVSIDALPAILPVNFVLLREQIIVKTVRGTKLDAAAAQAVVAFEVDSYDPGGKWGWSVLVLGPGSQITDPSELAEAQTLPLRAWAFKNGPADRFLRIETTSGQRPKVSTLRWLISISARTMPPASARVGTITLRLLVPQPLEPNRRRALLAVVDHCTVHNSLRTPPEVRITLGEPADSHLSPLATVGQ